MSQIVLRRGQQPGTVLVEAGVFYVESIERQGCAVALADLLQRLFGDYNAYNYSSGSPQIACRTATRGNRS